MIMTDAHRKLLALVLFLPASSLVARIAGIPAGILHAFAGVTGLYELYWRGHLITALLEVLLVYLLILWVLFMAGGEWLDPGPAARRLLNPRLLLRAACTVVAVSLAEWLLGMVILHIPVVGDHAFLFLCMVLWAAAPLVLTRLPGVPRGDVRDDDTPLLRGRGPLVALGILIVVYALTLLDHWRLAQALDAYSGSKLGLLGMIEVITMQPTINPRYWTHFAVLIALLYPRGRSDSGWL